MTMHLLLRFFLLLLAAAAGQCLLASSAAVPAVSFVTKDETNDFLSAFQATFPTLPIALYGDLPTAIKKSLPGDVIVACADEYPTSPVEMTQSMYQQIFENQLRVFVEFPSEYPPFVPPFNKSAPNIEVMYERAVVSSNVFESMTRPRHLYHGGRHLNRDFTVASSANDQLAMWNILSMQSCVFTPLGNGTLNESLFNSPQQWNFSSLLPSYGGGGAAAKSITVNTTMPLAIARVAGFDTAVFKFEGTNVYPMLMETVEVGANDTASSALLLLVTSKFSNFVSARYMPENQWGIVMDYIITRLMDVSSRQPDGSFRPSESIPPLQWTPPVHPAYSENVTLPADAEYNAFVNGIQYFFAAKLFPDAGRIAEDNALIATGMQYSFVPAANAPSGNGSLGLLQGASSAINISGSQNESIIIRTDCVGETAAAFAWAAQVFTQITPNPQLAKEYADIASNLLNFIYNTSMAQGGFCSDPTSDSFGLLRWGVNVDSWLGVQYGDDNSRAILNSLAAAAVNQDHRFNTRLLMALLGNLRTSGLYGYRQGGFFFSDLNSWGWRAYSFWNGTEWRPHYQSWIWACYLWGYAATNYQPFYDKAYIGIELMMQEFYAGGWQWTNGITQERARMVLPLSWLLRVNDTDTHRTWLYDMTAILLAAQQPSGAIMEEMGVPGRGQAYPPVSNSDYGTHEAPLEQENGDPVSDLLYSMNFAFLGLHEAFAVTGDTYFKDAEDLIAQFFARIQASSTVHPEVHGGWYRAFDYKLWNYWASAADYGWGPWSIETGWTQAEILSVYAMRLLNSSLWDATMGKVDVADRLNELLPIFGLPPADSTSASRST